MITRTSQPASGAMLISEMKEFAGFTKATQRYIRRSLDVAYGRRDPIECWARDEGSRSIRAKAGCTSTDHHGCGARRQRLDMTRVHWHASRFPRSTSARTVCPTSRPTAFSMSA